MKGSQRSGVFMKIKYKVMDDLQEDITSEFFKRIKHINSINSHILN